MRIIFFTTFLFIFEFVSGQVLCVQCFNQNNQIGLNVGSNNHILNGGFEVTDCPTTSLISFCPNSIYYSCNISNWTCIGGGDSTYCLMVDTSIFWAQTVEGIKSAYLGNRYSTVCSSSQVDTSCLVTNGCLTSGIQTNQLSSGLYYGGANGVSISQSVSGLIIGNIYVLEFWVGGEWLNPLFTINGLFAVDIGYGNTFLRNKPTHKGYGIGTRYLIQFKASASSQIIKFTNWGHVGHNSSTELIIDDVRLYSSQFLPSSIIQCEAGLNEYLSSDLKVSVSPNPSTGQFNFIGLVGENTIQITDITGRILISEKTYNENHTLKLYAAQGIYFYKITDKQNRVQQGKLLVQ
jgi:hypothetical protein